MLNQVELDAMIKKLYPASFKQEDCHGVLISDIQDCLTELHSLRDKVAEIKSIVTPQVY